MSSIAVMEQVIIKGDLAQLTPDQRAKYYFAVCQSVGLNPLTKPFDYISLNGRLTLYALKGATDQLRGIHGISITNVDVTYPEDLVVVTVTGTDGTGRGDTEVGAVSIAGLKGDARANAIMKAITKAKRRLTLSMVGLGMLDESETETIPSARIVNVDSESGEIIDAEAEPQPRSLEAENERRKAVSSVFGFAANSLGLQKDDVKALAYAHYAVESMTEMTIDQLRDFYRYLRDTDPESLQSELYDLAVASEPAF